MRNWLGQDINVGDLVYRGARNGNSSEFKIGEVTRTTDMGVVRVHWLFKQTSKWVAVNNNNVLRYYSKSIDSSGSPNINSLVKIDRSVLDTLRI